MPPSATQQALSRIRSKGSLSTQSFGSSRTSKELRKLRSIAKESGVDSKKIPIQGEDPDKFLSGGFIMDTFDILNAMQYGVTGLLKGTSFKEGVRTRQSFSDKDALGQFGIPGIVGGIVADIAVDPLTYIPLTTLFAPVKAIAKGLGKIPTISKAASKVKNAKAIQRTGDFLGKRIINRYGQDPVYQALDKRRIKNIGLGNKNVLRLSKSIANLDSVDQITIATARKAGKLDSLPPDLLEKAKPAFDELDRLGKEAVDAGLLTAETYEKNLGRYMARLYRTKEFRQGKFDGLRAAFIESKPLRIDIARFKSRQDIPQEVREAMGEIMEAGYPTATAMVQLTQAIENSKFFKTVFSKFGSDAVQEGMKVLPKSPALGKLSGKAVPEPIFDAIQEIVRTKTPSEKVIGNMVRTFKTSKVVLNPATHARNIMSNMMLNNFEGLSPARLDIYAEAGREISRFNKGLDTKWYKEAQEQGLGLGTFAAQELKEFAINPEAMGVIGKGKRSAAKLLNKAGELYEKEEQFAKMAQYIFQRKKGKLPSEAWEISERATFNYAEVTPFIRRMREAIWGYPFITFTYKATPQIARTLALKPTKISNVGKIKRGIENLARQKQFSIQEGKVIRTDPKELERERATESPWIRDGFYIKLPIKDKFGRSSYFDMTYILPFGELMDGGFFERGINRETGLQEGVPRTITRKMAFLNVGFELANNQDFFGNKIFLESDDMDKQLGDVARHLIRFFAPPLVADRIPGGYRRDGERRKGSIRRALDLEKAGIDQVENSGKQVRSLGQELLRSVGLKIQPIDIEVQEGYSDWQERKALQSILEEAGEIGTFSIPFKRKKK